MNKMLLAAPVLLPIAGGMLLLASGLFKRGGVGGSRKLALYVEGLVLVNSLIIAWLLFHRPEDGGRMVLFRLYGNLIVMFKLDGMGSVFAALIAFLWPLATLYALEYMRKEQRKSEFFAYYTMTYGVTAGVALAGNLLTMYLFYEMLTLVTFPLVLYPMTKEAVRASRRYLYYSIGGAAFAFIGLVFVLRYSATGNTEFIAGGVLDLAMAQADRNILLLIYVLAFFGFGVKAALLPCHGWLPRATVAPTPVTALLHAVAVVKSGAFAILRFTYFSFGTCFLFGSWVGGDGSGAYDDRVWLYHGGAGDPLETTSCIFNDQQFILHPVWGGNDDASWAGGGSKPYGGPRIYEDLFLFLRRGGDAPVRKNICI